MNRHPLRVFACLAILGFLAAGIASMHRYGYGDDEQWLVKRGEMSYQIMRAVFSGNLPRAGMIAEEPAEWIYHPSFYGFLNYRLVSPWLIRRGMSEIPSRHLLNLLIAALALAAVFRLAAEMFDEETALYSVFFLMFFPRFIAHAQFNPKDIPALAAVTVFVFYVYRWTRSHRTMDAMAAGLWMGLGATAHLGSLVLLPLFPMVMFLFPPSGSRRFGIPLCAFLGTALLTVYLLWPLLWVRPLGLVHSLRHFTGEFASSPFLYFGRVCLRSGVPWHYYPFFLLVSTPLVTWLFIGLGAWRFENRKEGSLRDAAWFSLVMWAALPVVVRMNPWVVKYNGIRHIFIAIVPLMIMAGCGGKVLMDFVRKRVRAGCYVGVTAVIGIGLVAYYVGQVSPIFPYEGDYFNEAFRQAYPKQIEDRFEFPAWLTCYREVVDWLDKNAAPDSVIAVPHRISVFSLYPKRPDLIFVKNGPADYTVVAGLDFATRRRYEGRTPVFEIQRYRSLLVAIFEDTPAPLAVVTPL